MSNKQNDIYNEYIHEYGVFNVTDEGLVKVEPKPIKIKLNGKKIVVKPDNIFYKTVSYYGIK